METKTTDSQTRLRLERTYPASREEVFDALTKPAMLSRWFAPGDEFEVVVDRFEAAVDGTYRIEMRHEGGNVHTCIGTVREIERPARLVYTWKWEEGEMPDTLVTWELAAVDDGTRLTLVHDRFPNAEARKEHLDGWKGCLAQLEKVL